MIDEFIVRLDREAGGRTLTSLETDVWASVEAKTRARRASRVVLGWQSGVLALAVASSVVMGAQAATSVTPDKLGVFSPRPSFAPSTLLARH